MERILEDQKSTIQTLEEDLLAVKYNADLSYQNITQDNLKLQELERENDQLRYESQKTKNQYDR